ncbi:LysR family transcriptional regulator [Algicella marina]|uniref:LysR family transcriptional regulator n=1 Tax=Algicella marina TaxID=2683284 RepID=A0A6P1T4E7_9RHOB|nr:LysR family transcriptional regulator [Algicella marina]QHQ36877.1 LysR family transcriptional regulator [Algicella marina]
MELPSQMLLFAKVVEGGSFSAAARTLGYAPSSVSKQIAQLEDKIGLRLLTRTQTGIVLTEEGRIFHQRCRDLEATLQETEEQFASMSGHPTGLLRVSCTVAFGKLQLLPVLPRFMAANPDIEVSLSLSDNILDLTEEQVDIGIRFAEQIEDPSAIVRKIGGSDRVICASPEYLARNGHPQEPEDLQHHNCLLLSTARRKGVWMLVGPNGNEDVRISGNLETDSADAIYHAVRAGLGVARLSTYLVGDDIAAARLIHLLPDYTLKGSDLMAIFRDKRNLPPKTRVFLDFLIAEFGHAKHWRRQALEKSA